MPRFQTIPDHNANDNPVLHGGHRFLFYGCGRSVCAWCGEPTGFVDDSTGAKICSTECADAFFDERRLPQSDPDPIREPAAAVEDAKFDALPDDEYRIDESASARRLAFAGACAACGLNTSWVLKRSGCDGIRVCCWACALAVREQPARRPEAEEIAINAAGVARSKDADGTRYDLISPIGLRRLAAVHAEWANGRGKTYGESNWLKGMSFSDTLNHAIRHLERWRAGDRSEDNLAKTAWGLFALMHFEETRPDLDDRPFKSIDREAE